MSVETDLHALLAGQCPRVFPDDAAFSTPLPLVTYQQIGGEAVAHTDNTLPGVKNGYFQINVVLDQCRTIRWIEEFSYTQGAIISHIVDAYDNGPSGDSCVNAIETAFPDLIYSRTGCMSDRYLSKNVDTLGPDRLFEFELTETTSVDVVFEGFMGAAIYVRGSCNSVAR